MNKSAVAYCLTGLSICIFLVVISYPISGTVIGVGLAIGMFGLAVILIGMEEEEKERKNKGRSRIASELMMRQGDYVTIKVFGGLFKPNAIKPDSFGPDEAADTKADKPDSK